jgi:hypothetical protein
MIAQDTDMNRNCLIKLGTLKIHLYYSVSIVDSFLVYFPEVGLYDLLPVCVCAPPLIAARQGGLFPDERKDRPFNVGALIEQNSGPESESELLYDWPFTDNQFVLATSLLRLTTSNFIFQLNTCGCSPYVTSSLTRGWVCRLQIAADPRQRSHFRSESHGTHDHILLSQI